MNLNRSDVKMLYQSNVRSARDIGDIASASDGPRIMTATTTNPISAIALVTAATYQLAKHRQRLYARESAQKEPKLAGNTTPTVVVIEVMNLSALNDL